MIAILVQLLFAVLIVWVILYVMGMIGLPEPAALIVKVILALVFLMFALRLFGYPVVGL